MKKVPIELFGPMQEIYFNIGRYAAIENLTKKSIGDIIGNDKLNVSDIAMLLSVGLRHCSQQGPQWYLDKIQELLDAGVEIEEIRLPIIKAIAGSGIMGRKVYLTMFPEEATEADKKAAADLKN